MRQNIHLHCVYSAMPGCDWRSDVWFIGNAVAYRVWSDNDFDEEPKRVLLKHAKVPLTWRQAIADIQALDTIGLGGDLYSDISVYGTPRWMGDLFKLAWCKTERAAAEQLPFLLTLEDAALELLYAKLGNLWSKEALSAIDSVAEAARLNVVPTEVLEQGLRELVEHEPMDAFIHAVERWCEQRQPPGPSLAQAAELRTADELLSLLSEPRPNDPQVAALLMQRWLALEPKPVALGRIGQVNTESSAIFLRWLVGRVGPTGFAALAASDPSAARSFATEFLAHANAEILELRERHSRNMARAMVDSMARSWERLKGEVLGTASTFAA